MMLELTKLITNWLKSIDKNQDTFTKNKKNAEKIRNHATLSKYKFRKQGTQQKSVSLSYK